MLNENQLQNILQSSIESKAESDVFEKQVNDVDYECLQEAILGKVSTNLKFIF